MGEDRQNILFCALEIYARVGGIQRFNRRVVDVLGARATRRNGHATVYSLKDPTGVHSVEESATLESFNANRRRFMWKSILTALRSDVLIIGHINLLVIAFLAKLLKPRLKTLLFAHGVEVWDTRDFRKRRFYEKSMLRFSVDRVASVSRYTADVMCKQFDFPDARVRIFPNAVDPAFEAGDGNRHPLGLLTVARLSANEQQKNVDKVIYAVAALKSRLPGLTLEIVGDGELRSELEALSTRLGLTECVRFLGQVSDADLRMAYRRASVFVLPSTKEGFGIVYLEAWLQGLAVIGARAGGAPEVIEDGVDGILVDVSDDSGSLSRAIERLVCDESLARRFALSGRRKIERLYLHEHFSQNLDGIICELTQESPISE